MTPGAYQPCHNRDEVIQSKAYDPELDERNPAGSVFCKGGAGYSVPWREADEMMHTGPAKWVLGKGDGEDSVLDEAIPADVRTQPKKRDYASVKCEDEELIRIFEKTYGKIKPRHVAEKTENAAKTVKQETKRRGKQAPSKTFILVDGYNLIFAWSELKALADKDMSLARDTLVRILCDYAAFRKCKIIAVFDAYARKGDGSVEECGGVTVVYTKEAQTADSYIEKTTKSFSQDSSATVRVVTSDMQEQFIILGHGGLRVSAVEFKREVEQNAREIKEAIESYAR
jgi:predicted RNA-binding protein with PIN domain